MLERRAAVGEGALALLPSHPAKTEKRRTEERHGRWLGSIGSVAPLDLELLNSRDGTRAVDTDVFKDI